MELPLAGTVSRDVGVGKIKISVLETVCLLDRDMYGPRFQGRDGAWDRFAFLEKGETSRG